MGYRTMFKLSIPSEINPSFPEEDEAKLVESFYSQDYKSELFTHNEWTDGLNWSTYEEELKSFSKQFPNIVFLLEGEGDGTLDIWKAYFKNGKVQYCPILYSFEEYNENELV